MATLIRAQPTIEPAPTAGAPGMGFWLSLALLTAAGLALRLVGLDARSLWVDEAYALYWASQPWAAIPGLLLRHETHPPLFYLLLHAWGPFTGSDPLARLPSALLGALVVPVTGVLGWQLGGRGVGLGAAGLLAISPLAIWYSQEARPYALLMLLVTLAALALLRLVARPGLVAPVGYALAAAAAFLTHYGALPALAGLALGLLPVALAPTGRPWRRRWLLSQVAAAGLCLPWVIAVVAQNWQRLGTAYVVTYRNTPPDVIAVRETLLDLIALGAPFWRLPGGRPEWLLVLGLGLATVGLAAASGPRRWLLLGWAVGTVALTWLIAQRYPIYFQTKVLVTVAPALALLTAAGLVWLGRRWRWVGVTAATLLLAVNVTGLWRIASGAAIDLPLEDWRGVAAYLARHAAPDDVLLFLPAGRVLPYQRAAAGREPLLATRGLPIDYAEATGTIEPPLRPDRLARLGELIQGRRQFWLVTVDEDDAPQINIPLALDYYAGRATLRERVDFPGIVLYRYTT